jgi:hypothetical protein
VLESATVNGTASGDIVFYLNTGRSIDTNTYTLSGRPNVGSGVQLRISNNVNQTFVCNTGTSVTFAFSQASSGSVAYFIFITSGTTCNNLTFYPQLELGSTATAYEPYTGGAPSPSPDYPQEIRVARGRNLAESYGHYSIQSNGSVESSGLYDTYVARVNAGEPYSFQKENSAYWVIGFFASMPSVGSVTYNAARVVNPASPIVAPIDGYMMMRCDAGATNVQIELGSVATPYVPYGYVGMEAQGKNLLKNTATSKTTNGVTFTVNADGSVLANGTATSDAILAVGVRDFLTLGETYTLSGCPSGGSSSTYAMTIANPSWAYETGNGYTFTAASASVMEIRIIVKSGKTANNLTFYPMLEAGSAATPYQPYYHTTTPIPLPERGWVGSLPDGTADTLTLDGAGKVTWEQRCNEKKL